MRERSLLLSCVCPLSRPIRIRNGTSHAPYQSTRRHGRWKVEATLAGEHRNTIYSVDWAPSAANAAAASAAARRSAAGAAGVSGGGGIDEGREDGGGMGAPCLATASGDDALRVFYEGGEGDSAAFGLDVEVRERGSSNIGLLIWRVLFVYLLLLENFSQLRLALCICSLYMLLRERYICACCVAGLATRQHRQ